MFRSGRTRKEAAILAPPQPPQPQGCKHDALPNLNGDIISPRVEYGNGADQMVYCLRCKKYFGKIVNQKFVALT